MKLLKVCELLEKAIWERKPLPDGRRLKSFTNGAVIGYEAGSWRFVEQNPNTGSHWAKMAKGGSRIIWVFKNNKWYARYVNKHITLL